MQLTENYTLLVEKINVFIKKYYLNKLLRGALFLGAGLFSAYVVITVTEYYGNFNTLFRTILFYGFIFLNLGLIARYIMPPLLARLKLGKSLTHDQAAEIIGRHFADIQDKLLNTLQLKKLEEGDAANNALIRASIDQKIENLRPVRFPSAINIKENNRYIKWVLLPLGVICIIGFAAPSILTESTKRLIRHNEYFAPVAPFKFEVENKVLNVVQGEDLNLDVKLAGNSLPADVYVETANNTFKLDKENTTKFHYLFTNIQQTTTFKLSGNGFESMPFEIKVSLRPSLLHFDVDLNYPAYLHKKNETLANAGDLTIPAGTTVSWHLHTQNATKLMFYMNSAPAIAQATEKDLFTHSERILKTSVYKITPLNDVVNRTDSALYRINVIEDEAPTINVMEKPDSISLKTFYFTGRIQDDHGFSNLDFHYSVGAPGDKANAKAFTKQVKADLSQPQADFFYLWDLKSLGIKAGDQVTYYFEVADNDGVNGPKKTKSQERTINLPDEKELMKELNASAEIIKQQMQSASKLAGQIEHDSQKLNQMLLNKSSLSFDEKKQIEDLLQKRKDLDELVKQIQEENKKNSYNRQESGQQSEDMAQKQQQMDQLMNNALDPKTREMLQKLQELLQDGQKESTRQQLQKMQNETKSSKKELDRLLELYKKLDFQKNVNQKIDQLNKLADKQEDLSAKTDPQAADKDKQAQADKNNKQNPQDKNAQQQQADKDKQAQADKDKLKALQDKLQQDKDKQQAEANKQQQADKNNISQADKDKLKALQDKVQEEKDKLQAEINKQQQANKDQQQADKDKQNQQNKNAQNQQNKNAQQQQADKDKQNQQDKNAQQQQDKNGQQDKNAQQQQDKNGQQQADKDKQDQQDKDKMSQEDLQKQQEQLNKEFEDLKKQIEDMKKADEEQAKKQDFEEPKQEEQQVEQQMQQSSQQLQQKENKKASKSQKQSAQKMRQMAQKMQQQQQDEEDKQEEVDEAQLRQLLKSLVNSSFDQERNMQDLKTVNTSDPNYLTLAQKQKAIKDNLKTAEDTLYSLSKRIPQIQATVNREVEAINSHIDDALQNLGDRRTAQANSAQQYAMTSMNNLALMLSDALSNMQDQASQSSKSSKSSKSKKQSKQQSKQSMKQLAQRQQQLNQNMQKAREQMQQQGGNPSQSQKGQMSEQLAKLAREQQEIRQAMQQQGLEDNKSAPGTIKDAEKTSQQMEQTEKDLVNRKITDDAIKRQQQITTRLLEYEKAEQEREQDEQRQSHVGNDMPPGFIKALQDYQQVKAKQTEQVKTVPPTLDLYYKLKIKAYFDQLNAK